MIFLELGLCIFPGDFNFFPLMLAMLTSFLIFHVVASDFPVATAAFLLRFKVEISTFHLTFLDRKTV
jgi:hypothetical protein